MKIYLFLDKEHQELIRYSGRLGYWINGKIFGFPEILKKNARFICLVSGKDISFQGYCMTYQDWKRIYHKKEKK